MEYKTKNIMSAITLTILATFLSTFPTHAQMIEKPYTFQPQNRASIAALMRTVEEGESSSGTVSSATGGPTTLVCGSDGSSSAKGSSSCIILNNSDGSILLDQLSDGDQTATSTETTTVDETINTGADDILAALNGE